MYSSTFIKIQHPQQFIPVKLYVVVLIRERKYIALAARGSKLFHLFQHSISTSPCQMNVAIATASFMRTQTLALNDHRKKVSKTNRGEKEYI